MLSASNNSVSLTKKHTLNSKWNILFDKSAEWISFKPQLGLKVYPCYACKNMFSSKLTFQDHINRRVVLVKYKCPDCTNTLTFYNRCSFLLHTRKHYSLVEGKVNLGNVEILLLPVELAGFERHENIPFLYDEEEELVTNQNIYMNAQFYTPDDGEAGKQVVSLRPYNLVFHYTENDNNVLMILKQIATNVPLCEFVSQEFNNRQAQPAVKPQQAPEIPEEPDLSSLMEPEIKLEPEDEFTMPVISKIESLNGKSSAAVRNNRTPCPECDVLIGGSMKQHFLKSNKPIDQSLFCAVCKYIAPTKCSLLAHERTHEQIAPHVCPECGKNFVDSGALEKHMEDMCFHLAKQVRFRCLAPKCGRIFLMPNTFTAHFSNHYQPITQCTVCNQGFVFESSFLEHAKQHKTVSHIKVLRCLVCNVSPITHAKSEEHTNFHLQDREICVYIFTCKYCRSYFRSTTTYAVHMMRCPKKDKVQQPTTATTTNCHTCGQKLTFREKETFKICLCCKQLNQSPSAVVSTNSPSGKSTPDDKKCMLCSDEIDPENIDAHTLICKYNNPVVNIQSLDSNSDDAAPDENKKGPGSGTIHLDSSSDSVKTNESANKGKKRKRSSLLLKSKSKNSEGRKKDLQAEQPKSFDGTYKCQLCYYKDKNRADFQAHILKHRDISTAYQCMECGQCFVVKPSLEKHLTHYHKISDTEKYIVDNNCFDKSAVQELEKNLKLAPGEKSGPVKKNQCSVCYEQFSDGQELSKHFRIHGMAFLMKATQ